MTTYTEDEAKTKWCPFARVRNMELDDDDLLNADPGEGDEADIQARQCIVAPFAGPAHNRLHVKGESSAMSAHTPGAYCIASACMAWRTGDGVHGFCGLAGKP